MKLDFPVLSDPELKAIDLYGVRHAVAGFRETADTARPAVYIIDRRGTIRYRNLADNWRIRPRPEQLLAQLAALP
jgi:peroxiredoxin